MAISTRRGEMADPAKFLKHLDLFVEGLPRGPIQDDDCLDLVGYLYGECDELEKCLAIYEKCLGTPSATREHVIEIAARYLVAAKKAQQGPRAETLVTSLLKDLRQFGMGLQEFDNSVETAFASTGVSSNVTAAIRAAVASGCYLA